MVGTPGRSGGNRYQGNDLFPVDGTPEPPHEASVSFMRHWRFLVANLPAVALRKIDAIQMGILCELLVEIEQLSELIEADPSDLKARSLRLRVSQQVSRLSAQFGLSPSDRQRLSIEPEQDEEDPVAGLLARMRASVHGDQ